MEPEYVARHFVPLALDTYFRGNSHELEFCLRQSDAEALFLVERFKSSDYYAMLRGACPEWAQVPRRSAADTSRSDVLLFAPRPPSRLYLPAAFRM